MRIFTIFFHPDRKTTFLGGAEKRFLEFLRFLSNGNFKVEVLVLESKPSLFCNKCVGVKTLTIDKPFKVNSSSLLLDYLSWILWDFKAMILSIPILLKEKPDLILSPNNTLPNVLPAFLTKLLFRKPLCVIVHHFDLTLKEDNCASLTKFFKNYRKVGYPFLAALFKALASILAISFLRKADMFISVSKFTAKLLWMFGIEREKVLISGNGVDLEKISHFRWIDGKIFDAVFVGRISVEKGIYDLIDAWKMVVSKRGKACLAVVGEGPELENFKAKIRDLRLEGNVVVFGGVSDEEKYKILCESKVFIFPSCFEGWSLAVAEALACGLPVICYEIPALKEVFGHCKSVFFVSQFDFRGLAEKVLEVLENFNIKDFEKNSLEFTGKFDWKKIFEKDLKFILSSFKNLGN